MEHTLTITELLLIGAAALLTASILSLIYFRRSRSLDKKQIDRGKCSPARQPDPALPKRSEKLAEESPAEAPSLIITVKRSTSAAAGNTANASQDPGYWCCRYCQTKNPGNRRTCVACGHSKR